MSLRAARSLVRLTKAVRTARSVAARNGGSATLRTAVDCSAIAHLQRTMIRVVLLEFQRADGSSRWLQRAWQPCRGLPAALQPVGSRRGRGGLAAASVGGGRDARSDETDGARRHPRCSGHRDPGDDGRGRHKPGRRGSSPRTRPPASGADSIGRLQAAPRLHGELATHACEGHGALHPVGATPRACDTRGTAPRRQSAGPSFGEDPGRRQRDLRVPSAFRSPGL